MTGSDSANHGHTAVVTAAELASAAQVVLNIQGSGDHPHTVTLTVTEVTTIAGGQRVQTQSSSNMAHAHTVTFN